MADYNSGPGWSDTQWEKVNKAVTEAFDKASVAGAFLTCYGPLPDSAEYVRDEHFVETGARVTVEDDTTLKLFNLTVKVALSREQAADDGLSSALLAFRRAANTLAQIEDFLVFNGFDSGKLAAHKGADQTVLRANTSAARSELDAANKKLAEAHHTLKNAKKEFLATQEDLESVRSLKRGATELKDAEAAHRLSKNVFREKVKTVQHEEEESSKASAKVQDCESEERLVRAASIAVTLPVKDLPGLTQVDGRHGPPVAALKAKGMDVGESLVTAVVNAISDLEDDSHPGPFACVLGSNLFEEAHRPRKSSMVLPADRIAPILNGPLLRSGQMNPDTGIVVSLAGSDIDIVVATPPKVQFLQINEEAKYLFRVYEKFIWRIKDRSAVRSLVLE